TPTPLALKVISKRDQDPEQLALTRLEVSIHASVPRHPNIVRLLEWHEDADALYLVLERCDYGDLFDLVLAPPATPANTPIASALAACHSVGVFHRDLKPENVLLAGPLDAQGYPLVARLADFGLATRESFSLELGLGTRSYLAPECLDDRLDGYVSAPADVF
ncbi:kinase-like domain-containing protein, partial [Blastocladiella britannica]